MSLKLGSRHLDDADLVRYMDHQLDRDGLRKARSHLGVCPECTARLEEMERESALVSSLIADIPVEMPDPGRRAVALAALERTRVRRSATGPIRAGVMLRAAAIVLVAFTAIMATRPGRAWMADQVERFAGDRPGPVAARILEWLGREPTLSITTEAAPAATVPRPSEVAADSAAPAARMAPGSGPLVRFTPPGPDVVIEFASIQRAGGATLTLADVPDATGRVTSGIQDEALVPIAGGLRVRNAPESRATYELIVPVRYRFVRVWVADREFVFRPTRGRRDAIWTIELRQSALDEN